MRFSTKGFFAYFNHPWPLTRDTIFFRIYLQTFKIIQIQRDPPGVCSSRQVEFFSEILNFFHF